MYFIGLEPKGKQINEIAIGSVKRKSSIRHLNPQCNTLPAPNIQVIIKKKDLHVVMVYTRRQNFVNYRVTQGRALYFPKTLHSSSIEYYSRIDSSL
jgi:hypothetical protein